MRKILLLAVFIFIFAGAARAQTYVFCAEQIPCNSTANNTHSGTETFTGAVTSGLFNSIIIVDGVKYATLNAAVAACPATAPAMCHVLVPPGTFTVASQIAPTVAVIIEGAGATYANGGWNCATTINWTGGASAPFLFTSYQTQGSRLKGFCLNATSGPAPPVFVDIDNASGGTKLENVVIDTPTVQATVAGIRYGNTGTVVDPECEDTFVRDAAPIGYDLINVQAHFTGFHCRSLQNTTNEWVLGGTGSNVVSSFHCWACTSEHGNAGGTPGIVINNAINAVFDSSYFECGGATGSWCADIPSSATLAQNITFLGTYAGSGQSVGTNAFLHTNLATATVTVQNNRIGDTAFANSSYIVKNDAAARITLLGNNQSITGGKEYENAGNVSACGDTVAGLVAPCTFPSTIVTSLPSASTVPGAIMMVTDSTSIASEGQACSGSSSHFAMAVSTGSGGWKCF
jgi:hypothetical protein